jgi:hypothetical protein
MFRSNFIHSKVEVTLMSGKFISFAIRLGNAVNLCYFSLVYFATSYNNTPSKYVAKRQTDFSYHSVSADNIMWRAVSSFLWNAMKFKDFEDSLFTEQARRISITIHAEIVTWR